MPMHFSRPTSRPGQINNGVAPIQSPLQKITQQYRESQATAVAQTSQQITNLAKQREKLTVAETAATKANNTPLNSYLNRSGQMVEHRIQSLQNKINGKLKDS